MMAGLAAQEGQFVSHESLLETRKRKRDSSSVAATRSGGTYERRKAVKACLVCRARKTKCDNVRPICGFCKSTGGECRYSSDNSSRFDQASLTIIEHLKHIENLIGPLATSSCRCCCNTTGGCGDKHSEHQVRSFPQFGDSPETPSGQALASGYVGQGSLDIYDNALPNPEYLSPQAVAPHANNENDETASETDAPPSSFTLMRACSDLGIEAILQWPVFKNRLSHLSDNTLMQDLGQPSSPHDESTAGTPYTADPTRQDETVRLDWDTVDRLVGNFLVNNFPSNPILDPESLRRDARRVSEAGLRWDGRSCLVLLVLAIGSISTPITNGPSAQSIDVSRSSSVFQAAEIYFRESQRRIGALSCENSLVSTQVAFFTAVFLSSTMRILASWKYFVMAGTQCLAYLSSRGIMNIGTKSDRLTRSGDDGRLHPEGSIPPEPVTRALEESLYWVILKGEAELCLQLGLPGSGLHENTYPHTFPCPPNLEDTAPSPGLFERSKEIDRAYVVQGWLYYLGEIALRRLQNRVFIHHYGGRGAATSGDYVGLQSPRLLSSSIAHFDSQLDQWMQSLPRPLQFSPGSTENLDDQLRWVLCGHRIDVIELLRFPVFRSIFGPSTTGSGGTPAALLGPNSADNLRLASEFLENAVQRIEISAEGSLHRHQGSWLTIRGSTRSALTLIGAKLVAQEQGRNNREDVRDMADGMPALSRNWADDILPLRWETAVLQVLDMLRAWETESKDLEKLTMILETLLGMCRRG